MTAGERDGPATGAGRDASAGDERPDVGPPAGARSPDGEDEIDADGAAGVEGSPVANRVIEASDEEEELVAAPVWATFLLVLTPFVIGLLVIAALRWLL